MAVTKPTKAQVTALITTVAGVLILADTTLPVSAGVKMLIGFIIGVIGIIGNVYGVYKVPNEISSRADTYELRDEAAHYITVADVKDAAYAKATPAVTAPATPAPVAPVVGD